MNISSTLPGCGLEALKRFGDIVFSGMEATGKQETKTELPAKLKLLKDCLK